MRTVNDLRANLPAGGSQAPGQPLAARARAGRLSRETLVVRGLQVSVGLLLLGLWQLADAPASTNSATTV